MSNKFIISDIEINKDVSDRLFKKTLKKQTMDKKIPLEIFESRWRNLHS